MKLFGLDTLDPIDFKRKHYVAWSGGCDSTLILDYIIEQVIAFNEFQDDADKVPYPTVLISEPCFISPQKLHSERNARHSYLAHLRERGIHLETCVIEMRIDHFPLAARESDRQGMVQPAMWILQFMPFVPADSVVHFGFVLGDSFWPFVDKFENMLANYLFMLNKPEVLCKFDISHMNKTDVIELLMKRDLMKYTWTCETPERVGVPCGKCRPCLTNLFTENFLKTYGGRNDA